MRIRIRNLCHQIIGIDSSYSKFQILDSTNLSVSTHFNMCLEFMEECFSPPQTSHNVKPELLQLCRPYARAISGEESCLPQGSEAIFDVEEACLNASVAANGFGGSAAIGRLVHGWN